MGREKKDRGDGEGQRREAMRGVLSMFSEWVTPTVGAFRGAGSVGPEGRTDGAVAKRVAAVERHPVFECHLVLGALAGNHP